VLRQPQRQPGAQDTCQKDLKQNQNKPYAEFPLTPHQNGQWCKKIKGKIWFFGVWPDSNAALRKYLDEVDEIQAGRDPRKTVVAGLSSAELSVYDLCNMFLERQQARAKAGQVSNRQVSNRQVSNRHFSDCLQFHFDLTNVSAYPQL